jgi:hypothetical protein
MVTQGLLAEEQNSFIKEEPYKLSFLTASS